MSIILTITTPSNTYHLTYHDLFQIIHRHKDIARDFIHELNKKVPEFLSGCLLIAVGSKNLSTIKFLLDEGVDPNIYCNGTTALLEVFKSDITNAELISLLIRYKASPFLKNRYDETAYDILNREQEYLPVETYEKLLAILDSYFPLSLCVSKEAL
jgi:hypothetical protein